MAEGFQKPENQLAYDAAPVRQVSYLISFPLVQPISTTCMPRKDQVDKVSDATEMVFRPENYTYMFAISLLIYFLDTTLGNERETFCFPSNPTLIALSSCFISLNFISCYSVENSAARAFVGCANRDS